MAHYLRAVSPVQLARPGRAFEEFLTEHLDPLYRAALAHGRGDAVEAEDLLQETVRLAFWQLDQIGASEDPRAWFFALLSRTSQLRRRGGGPPLVLLHSRMRRPGPLTPGAPPTPYRVRERLFYTVAELRTGAGLFRHRRRGWLLVAAALAMSALGCWAAGALMSDMPSAGAAIHPEVPTGGHK